MSASRPLRQHFIMEDSCLQCQQGADASKTFHVELWLGPSLPRQGQTMFGQPLIDCEDNASDGRDVSLSY